MKLNKCFALSLMALVVIVVCFKLQKLDYVETNLTPRVWTALQKKFSVSAAPKEMRTSKEFEMKESLLDSAMTELYGQIPQRISTKELEKYDTHQTLPAVLQSAAHMARIHRFFEVQKVETKTQMFFYFKCAKDAHFYDSVRAVCAARASEGYRKLTGKRISRAIFGPTIANLVKYVQL